MIPEDKSLVNISPTSQSRRDMDVSYELNTEETAPEESDTICIESIDIIELISERLRS